MLRAFMQEEVPPPRPTTRSLPGRWVAEPVWPLRAPKTQRFHLDAGGALRARAGRAVTLTHRSEETVGLAGGEWCPHGIGGYGPQSPPTSARTTPGASCSRRRHSAGRSRSWGSPPCRSRSPSTSRSRSSPSGSNDVFPDGRVSRVTFGVLNLTHRDSHEHPAPMPVGKRLTVRVPLNDIAYSWKAGHRIRVAISTAYWPMVWPAPEPVTLRLTTGASVLELPLRARRAIDRKVRFAPPEQGPPMAKVVVEAPSTVRVIERDVVTGTVTVRAEENDGRAVIVDTGVEIGRWVKERLAITEGDPLSAETEMGSTFTYAKGPWQTRVTGVCRLRATRTEWLLSADLDAWEGDAPIFSRHADVAIPRDLV